MQASELESEVHTVDMNTSGRCLEVGQCLCQTGCKANIEGDRMRYALLMAIAASIRV